MLYNPVNQGYGGNQKLGYHYAIEHGFDFVALLHGDGQYAPEMLGTLTEPLRSRRGRRRLRIAHAGAEGRAQGRHAALQIFRQSHSHRGSEPAARNQAFRISQSGYRVYYVDAIKALPSSAIRMSSTSIPRSSSSS